MQDMLGAPAVIANNRYCESEAPSGLPNVVTIIQWSKTLAPLNFECLCYFLW